LDVFQGLRKRLAVFAGLISSQFDRLHSEGVHIENEEFIKEMLKGEAM
jgi:hypothetical protein